MDEATSVVTTICVKRAAAVTVKVTLEAVPDQVPEEYPEVEFDPIEFTEGYYRLLNDKYLRKTPEVKATNKIKVSECSEGIKAQLEYQTGYARFEIGQDVYLTKFKKDKKGNTWGKVRDNKITTWICVLDKSGEQVERIDL